MPSSTNSITTSYATGNRSVSARPQSGVVNLKSSDDCHCMPGCVTKVTRNSGLAFRATDRRWGFSGTIAVAALALETVPKILGSWDGGFSAPVASNLFFTTSLFIIFGAVFNFTGCRQGSNCRNRCRRPSHPSNRVTRREPRPCWRPSSSNRGGGFIGICAADRRPRDLRSATVSRFSPGESMISYATPYQEPSTVIHGSLTLYSRSTM